MTPKGCQRLTQKDHKDYRLSKEKLEGPKQTSYSYTKLVVNQIELVSPNS